MTPSTPRTLLHLFLERARRHPEGVALCAPGMGIEAGDDVGEWAECARHSVLLEHELPQEDGELTPTLKIRRPVVLERYGDRMEALYLSPEP